MNLLELEKYNFQYPDGRQALTDLSLTIQPAEKVALVGLNGAGKTTLLWSICGVLRGQGGIRVAGLELNRPNLLLIRQRVGLAFQDPRDQLFMLTVAEEVEFGPINLGWPAEQVELQVTRALELTGISQLRPRITQHLSYGEQKRVALAAILALEPELLLLDEPTSNLDLQGRRQLLRVLKNLPQALLVATHDLELATELCSRVVLLEQGRKVLDGPVAQLQQKAWLRRLGAIE